MNKKLIFSIVVSIEIILIIFLFFIFLNKKCEVLGESVSIIPLQKKNLLIEQTEKLKYFYELQPNTKITDKQYFLSYIPTYTINADGLNERFDYEVNKPTDAYRIIALGDSFTFGHYVDTKDNWTEKLEDKLNNELKCKNIKKFEVINLGVPGYDIQYSVERFRRKGQKYNPDLVVWFLKSDDFYQVYELLAPIINSEHDRMEKSGELEQRLKNNEVNPDRRSALKIFQEKYKPEDLFNIQKNYLGEFNNYYNKSLLVVSFTDTSKSLTKFINEYAQKRLNTHFYQDIPPLSANQMIEHDQHPNPQGHIMIGNSLFNYLKDKQIIKCDSF